VVIEDPSAVRVAEELGGPDFLTGVGKGRWRVVRHTFPLLDIAIAATEPDGTASEYVMRFELTNYPAQAPMVRIWDVGSNGPLPRERRPQGNPKVALAFQQWGDDTVYRPWDRRTGPHNFNAANLPHLAWRPDRDLMFMLEDLNGILNLNARALRHRRAA
jgi:hypothetical protein